MKGLTWKDVMASEKSILKRAKAILSGKR